MHHVGYMEELERQMCSFVPGASQKSPDNMDALVWAITELVVDPPETVMVQTFGEGYRISPV